MGLTRRRFLHLGGAGLLTAACAPGAATPSARLWRSPAEAAARHGEPLLVVIFLRGGADGLHLVPPVGERGYAAARAALALGETLPFATGFGLHPALEPLLPVVERGELAVVHAVGSPHPTRSHFEAQDFMEAGEPGAHTLLDGWLARALRGGGDDPFTSLALTGQLPLSLRGSGSFAMSDRASFGLPGSRTGARDELAALYARAGGDPVAEAGSRALAALDEFERRLGPARGRPRRGRGGGAFLARSADELLALEASGLGLRAVFLESSGWDTHINQGGETGQLANWIGDLGEAAAKLCNGLRGRRELVLVAMTEFGRTVRPNGSRGTDHGHGSVMLIAGPRVRGGLHGDWRGLDERVLHEGRDLPVTSDWRSVLSEALAAHLGGRAPADTFPGFEPETLTLFR